MWCRQRITAATRLDGKNAVVTGATSGVGRAVAAELYRRGATVILGARSLAKGEAVKQELLKQVRRGPGAPVVGNGSGPPAEDQPDDGEFIRRSGDVDVILLELSSFPLVRFFAKRVAERYRRIHLLVNAAAVYENDRLITLDELETTFGVNYMSHFLLTQLLLPRLRAAAPSARIVNLVCDAHRMEAQLPWADLLAVRYYDPVHVYGCSKLAMVMFSRELGRRLRGSGITVLAADPGHCDTPLGAQLAPGFSAYVRRRIVYNSPAAAALTPLFCALEPDLEEASGGYFSGCRQVQASPAARSDEDAAKLWRISMGILTQGIRRPPTPPPS